MGVGSGAITNYQLIVRTIVDELNRSVQSRLSSLHGQPRRRDGGGSDGDFGRYGITEEAMGCPLCIGTGTQVIGTTQDGLPVQIDAFAAQADGIIVVNRIKAHTAFMGDYESGLMKMLAIGLAKQAGRTTAMPRLRPHGGDVPKFGKAIIQYSRLLFGLAIVETPTTTLILSGPCPRSPLRRRNRSCSWSQGQHEPDSDPGGGRADRP